MTSEQALNKLRRLRDWNKMTGAKRDALDVAIKAGEAHDVEKECGVKQKAECLFFKDGPNGGESGKSTILLYCCPECGEGLRMVKSLGGLRRGKPFPKYCPNCGQRLKAPEE